MRTINLCVKFLPSSLIRCSWWPFLNPCSAHCERLKAIKLGAWQFGKYNMPSMVFFFSLRWHRQQHHFKTCEMSYQTSASYRQIDGGSDANSRQLTMTANSCELSYIFLIGKSCNVKIQGSTKSNKNIEQREW